jgi:DNA primase
VNLSPQWLDELRLRTSLSGLIGRNVKLQKAGREFKACCPFHNEKTPSFTVNDEKGFYHCLAAETPVITRQGRIPIAELAGTTVEILTRGGRWIPATFENYGRQQLWEIGLSRNGVRKAVFATSGHRWFVRDRRAEVLTKQLRPGQRLESVIAPSRSNWEMDPEGVRHGIIFGDGTMYRGGYGTINLHGEKDMCLAIWFPDQRHDRRERPGAKRYLRIYGGHAFSGMKELPSGDASESYLLGFLAGYLAADGHVAKDGTVILNSARGENLEAVRDISTLLGIATYGRTTQIRAGFGREASALHRIHFVTSTLSPELFLNEESRRRFENRSKAFDRLRWTVTHVSPTDRVEDVYCATVPGEHAFAIDDNILTGNCFGCGAHGDAIRFLTDARGLAFMDAVKELADQAGMEVPAPDPRAQAKAERAAGLHEVMEAAAAWFVEQLDGVEGHAARAYLKERRVGEATRRGFGLGYAPDARGKLRAALKGFGNEKLVEAGLLIAPDDDKTGGGKEPYDRFRGRLMFPIRDVRGRVHRLFRPYHRRRRAQISELPGYAPVRQGPQPVQHREGGAGQPGHAAGDRRRGADGRGRACPGRVRGCGGPARHRADRRAARPALAALPLPPALLRRRRGRAEGGDPRGDPRAARRRAGAFAGLRHPPSRTGSGRSDQERRPRGLRGPAGKPGALWESGSGATKPRASRCAPPSSARA